MSSHLPAFESDPSPAATPLGATLRRRWRLLGATFLAATLVAFVADAAAGVDAGTVVVDTGTVAGLADARDSWILLVELPVTEHVLRLQRASLVGLAAVVVATPLIAARESEDVTLRRGAGAFLVALGAALVGVAVGVLVGVDAVLALRATGWVDAPVVGDRFWLAELVVATPAVVGVAAALPATVVGAARSGLVGRRTTTRQRWLAVLALLCFVSVYSPSDSLTFVLGVGAVLGGLLAGLGLLEYDVA